MIFLLNLLDKMSNMIFILNLNSISLRSLILHLKS